MSIKTRLTCPDSVRYGRRRYQAVQFVILESAALVVSCNELIKAKIHYTSLAVASPQQVATPP